MRALIPRVLVLITSVLFCAPVLAQEHPWDLKKDKNGIKVYTRKVDGSPLLEFKAVMKLEVPRNQVMAFYEKIERYPEWFYQCAEARLLEEEAGEQIVYYVMAMPWPVSDRDSVYAREKSVELGGDVVYRLSARPEAYPEQPGKVRVPYLKILWKFKALPTGGTEVMFQQHCDAGGSIPAALANSLSVNMPFKTFENLRKILTAENPSK